MKYFRPALFVQLQNRRDATAHNAASIAWEKGIADYRARLEVLWDRLPMSVRRLLKDFRLHDADVVAMDQSPRTLAVTLNLDPPQAHFLVLTYHLADKLSIDRAALPPDMRSRAPKWLYDEIDVEGATSRSRRAIWSHNIFLSNGWEMKVRFSKMVVSLREALLPCPDGEPVAVVPRSA